MAFDPSIINQYPAFLEEVAIQLYAKHQQHISTLTIVFPHSHATLVFQQYLASHIRQPIWSPQLVSIETFIHQLSQLQAADTLTLVFELYQTLQVLQPYQEPFERFYFWGAMLLQDFDVIDRYLVNAAQLFTNLRDQKALSHAYEYLTETQRAAIQAFWKSFEKRLSTHQDSFLQLWTLLPQLYQRFKERLLAQKLGYKGLCYRMVWEALTQGTLQVPYQQLAFVGFHALNPAEEKIFAWCKANLPTTFYWDLDAYYMEDEQQEAGLYLRRYQRKASFQSSFHKPFPRRIQDPSKNIQLIAVASAVGQAQVIGTQLEQLIKTKGVKFNPAKTAIVMADETLLLPILHALPPYPVHVSLGYPLKNTAIYQLLTQLLVLQHSLRHPNCPQGYLPSQPVLAILRHPYVRYHDEILAKQTIATVSNTPYVAHKTLTTHNNLYATLFKACCPVASVIQYCSNCLTLLSTSLPEENELMWAINQQACYQLQQQLKKLNQIVAKRQKVVLQDFIKLFQQLVHPLRIPFNQETAIGIQVLPILETKNLDFDNVFILAMNEGIFPPPTNQPSFIPYNLRKGHGLPTIDEHQAALYAYQFYRLLQRAQNVCITYSTQTALGNAGEMSRFLWQLCYEANLPIQQHFFTYTFQMPTNQPIVIQKDAPLRQQLAQFSVQSGQLAQNLTPSALNTYLDCRLKFYFQYIVKLKQLSQPKETIDALSFGNLLHKAMEKLYTPFLTMKPYQFIQAKDLIALRRNIDKIVQEVLAVQENVAAGQGRHPIAQAVLLKLIHRIVTVDSRYAPFALIGLELGRRKPFSIQFELDANQTIGLGGMIDRVDYKDQVIRILDYKTGLAEQQIESIPSLFNPNVLNRNKTAFQVLFYAWLFKKRHPQHQQPIIPGIMSSRTVFEDRFDSRFSIKQVGSSTYTYLEDITPYQAVFEAALRQLLQEIFNPEVPFTQTAATAHCATCPYQGICQRH